MTIHWKVVEQYFAVVLFVLQFYPVCNFGKFIKFGLGTVTMKGFYEVCFVFQTGERKLKHKFVQQSLYNICTSRSGRSDIVRKVVHVSEGYCLLISLGKILFLFLTYDNNFLL